MPQKLANRTTHHHDWMKGLAAISVRDFTLENVQDYIIRHAVRPETLDKVCYFSKGCYTRNLIFKNDLFECMTVCWEVGQHSRIHNHRDQNCWMSAPIGRLRVQNYRVDQRDVFSWHLPKSFRRIPTISTPTHPAYVNPIEPVHEVINSAEFNQRAVSIHVYSKPFDSCEVYLRDQGTYSDVPLFYTSEYGKLNPSEKLL